MAYEGESIYNYLQVKEDEENIILSTNVLFGVQSILKKQDGLTGMYYDYAMAAPFMAGIYDKENVDLLILGMGTGTYASQCKKYFDNITIEGVEIDKKITMLTEDFFELPADVSVTTYDGRAYLNAVEKTYDIIMVDAYQDITIPFQMSSVEFFTLVRDHLKEDGVMVVNMNMRGEKEGNINQRLADTISEVFSEVYTVDVVNSTNRELFASNSPSVRKVMEENIQKQKSLPTGSDLARMMAYVSAYKPHGYRMTDDKAPVELLGMQVIDALIEEEVDYYKKIYDQEGLRGLIDKLF